MGRKCKVCYHEARPEIEAAIRGKVHYEDIAKRFGLGRGPVGRHARNHMDKAIAQGGNNEIEPLGATGTVEQRLDALLRKAEQLLMKAEAGSSLDTQIRALAECRHQVELLAKVIGDLRDDTTIQILQVMVKDD